MVRARVQRAGDQKPIKARDDQRVALHQHLEREIELSPAAPLCAASLFFKYDRASIALQR